MADLSRNGSLKFGPSSSGSGGAGGSGDCGIRGRTGLALDLGSPPMERRNRIASLSDLAFNEAGPSTAAGGVAVVVVPNEEKGKTAAAQTPTPTQFLFPKNVTEEQEAYASGFELALKEIYKEKGPPAAIADSTDPQGPICGDVNPAGIDVSSAVSVSTVSAQANSIHALPFPFRKDATPTQHLDPTIASGSNSCASFLQSFCRSNQVTRSETTSRQESRCATMGQNVALDERNAALRSGSLSFSQFESCAQNVAQSSRDVGSAELLLRSRAQMSAGRSPEGNGVGGWIPSAASIPHIHSHVTTIPLNHQNPTRPVRPSSAVVSSAAGFGSAVPVSSHTRFGNPMLPSAGTVPHAYDPQGGFHGCGSSQRMLFSPGSTSLPVSGIHPTMGLEIPVNPENYLWTGPSSTAEPGSWIPAKVGVAPVGVVNMDDQERMKLERKRAKNRVAAQRCQMRKLERIARLEDKAEKLREQNAKLLQTIDDLRSHVSQLKKQITAHANKGCRLMFPDVTTAFNPAVSSL